MISRVAGRLTVRDLDRVEVLTAGGVGYEIAIPRTIYEKLPPLGREVELLTLQVVREDALYLFGFLDGADRMVFNRLMLASGVGPRLALALMSAMPTARLVRAIRERDIPALTSVSGVGKKTAERIALELAGKLDDVPIVVDQRPAGVGVDEALKALTVLGYAPVEAERALRTVVEKDGTRDVQTLIRAALAELA